jgi:hypothetical protein
MSDVGQHLLSGNALCYPIVTKDLFSPSSPGALSGLTSTLLFQPCTSLPSCASCPSLRSAATLAVDLIKTRLQQGDASLGTKSALPVLMRTTLTFLSVQSSRCHSFHHTVDRLFLRGTRSLARHTRIVNPVHSFTSFFLSFLDWLFAGRACGF